VRACDADVVLSGSRPGSKTGPKWFVLVRLTIAAAAFKFKWAVFNLSVSSTALSATELHFFCAWHMGPSEPCVSSDMEHLVTGTLSHRSQRTCLSVPSDAFPLILNGEHK
jgi:hypothetical protein